jgi:uncharacterized membrane protein YhaH (DUF805 family)
MDAFTRPWRLFADFNGRSRRSEYWAFWITFYVFIFGLAILTAVFSPSTSYGDLTVLQTAALVIMGLFFVVSIVPGLAVSVRRCHDLEHSGFFLLLSFIPIVGTIVGLYLAFAPGTEGENDYGPAPEDLSVDYAEAFS